MRERERERVGGGGGGYSQFFGVRCGGKKAGEYMLYVHVLASCFIEAPCCLHACTCTCSVGTNCMSGPLVVRGSEFTDGVLWVDQLTTTACLEV